MKLQSKYADIVLNLAVAVAISLVVNFSYLVLLLIDQKNDDVRHPGHAHTERRFEGVLRLDPDGHGYLVSDADSIYVPLQRVRRLGLSEGDRLAVGVYPARNPAAHSVMGRVERRNGEVFDYADIFRRPSEKVELTIQLLYYLVVSYVLLSILTSVHRRYSRRRLVRRYVWCVVAAVVLYFLAPVTDYRSGRIEPNFSSGRMFDYMLLLKSSFAVAVSMLYGWVYVLITRQQAMSMENERLKNENLTTRYDMLVGQINPHFFFNSLNSLSMLVREGLSDKALTYIDQLSYTFRYILQNGQSTLTTLGDELRFARAYGYLFKIRYADKLFFDVDVPDAYLQWMLPALSLQPLLGNAVKHNAITTATPLHISIRVCDGVLEVSNPRHPKLEAEPSTGIGLTNLSNRWRLATGRDIEIVATAGTFTVRLPLMPPAPCSAS